MKGIDVYSGDNVTSFEQIKNSGVDICYIKATEGLTYNDSTVQAYHSQAQSAGLKVGFYHYLHLNDPVAEAQHFLSVVKGLTVDCIYMIDVEDDTLKGNVADTSDRVRQFANYLIAQGLEVGIYTGEDFYNNCLNSTVKDLRAWIADYSQSPDVPYIGFQYSESGTVPGINGNVDLDTFTEDILIKDNEEDDFMFFNENYYLQTNPDVAAAVKAGTYASGKAHWDAYGQNEWIQHGRGDYRRPHPVLPTAFTEGIYMSSNTDVASAVAKGEYSCGAHHWMAYGWNENRKYN